MRVHEATVAPDAWVARVGALAEVGACYLDLLTAVDHPAEGRIELVLHLVALGAAERHLLVTSVDRADPAIGSLVGVLPGVGWHEREVHEMFGVAFLGNPDLRPLLTTGATPPPLLRTTPLPTRVATAWPGARDPADRPAAGTSRAAHRPRTTPPPPGVPAEWSR